MASPAAAVLLLSLAAVSATAQHASTPLSESESELLAEARHAALVYSTSLPDFICTQIVRRTSDPQGNGRWRVLDTLTIKLSYFEHREDYKLMLINGKATQVDYMHAGGAISTGEFGTRLLAVFHPRSAAQFTWKGPAKLRKHKVSVFEYRVPLPTSSYLLQVGPLEDTTRSLVVAYHGEVWVDEESHMVLRLTQQADIPPGFPITGNSSEIEYDYTNVGARPFLLPAKAHVVTKSARSTSDNEVEFKDYRKFNTEATISFGTEDEKPKPPKDDKDK